MEGLKEIFELLGKAKDMRLNVAIFLVSLGLLAAERKLEVALAPLISGLLQTLCFITAIVIVSRGLGWCYDLLEKRKSRQREVEQQALAREIAKAAAIEKKNKVATDLETLDIFQLLILQDLKKANTASVAKGAHLYTLKNLGIIRSVATGERRESVQLTEMAKSCCDEQFWSSFDILKTKAAFRFFKGLEPKELAAFAEFKKSDEVTTSYYTGRATVESEAGRILSKYSESILFQQPQRGYKYEIDLAARNALINTYNGVS